MVGDYVIEVKNIKKSYGNTHVLRGLSLKLKRGATLVILGKSGAGKTIMLKHIIGLITPDDGSVSINGVDISNLSCEDRYIATRDMGMLFQNSTLFDSMNIGENVSLYLRENFLRHGKITLGEIKRLTSNALESVGLKGTEKMMPSDLSGGMKKRAGIAGLRTRRPKCILYDEPTQGLDQITAMNINEMILRTQSELQATSIVVTHDISTAIMVGDLIGLHENGIVSHISPPDKFFSIKNETIQFLKTIAPHSLASSRSYLR